MTSPFSRSTYLRCMISWSLGAACLVLASDASAGPSDVTAAVNDTGTLEIKRARGTSGNEGSFFVAIRLEGGPDEISVFVSDAADDVLLDTFCTLGDADHPPITSISVDADQSLVSLGSLFTPEGFKFVGDISIDVRTGGLCQLANLDMSGDLVLGASSGGIRAEYRLAAVAGDVTLHGGPEDDAFGPMFGGGSLVVDGSLYIDGGPGNEFIRLQDAFVSHNTLIDLGQSSGGNDADFCELSSGQFLGNVTITGDEGDDAVFFGEFFSFNPPTIGGDLLVDLGNGADRLLILGLTLIGEAPMIFLDGGNGNADELSVHFFEIFSDEFIGFETVTIP